MYRTNSFPSQYCHFDITLSPLVSFFYSHIASHLSCPPSRPLFPPLFSCHSHVSSLFLFSFTVFPHLHIQGLSSPFASPPFLSPSFHLVSLFFSLSPLHTFHLSTCIYPPSPLTPLLLLLLLKLQSITNKFFLT